MKHKEKMGEWGGVEWSRREIRPRKPKTSMHKHTCRRHYAVSRGKHIVEQSANAYMRTDTPIEKKKRTAGGTAEVITGEHRRGELC